MIPNQNRRKGKENLHLLIVPASRGSSVGAMNGAGEPCYVEVAEEYDGLCQYAQKITACFGVNVAHTQDPSQATEKPVIRCHKCGEPCKGEVLRVQSKHFHIKCFICKGETRPRY
eukprot:XP_017945309.1 PREDICTED: actin-binding LIM protein 1-like isoform X2 [Xenopus tropicalis]